MMPLQMKPLLKGHVFFMETQEGVYFNGGSQSVFMLKGKGIYKVVSSLIESLNGSNSVSEILQALPRQVYPIFELLIKELQSRNLLVDQLGEDEVLMTAPLREAYADLLNYFRDNVPSYQEAFMNWRATPVALAGRGQVYRSLLRSLASLGLAQLSLIPADEQTADSAEDILSQFQVPLGMLQWDTLSLDSIDTHLQQGGYVIYGDDELMFEDGGLLDRLMKHPHQRLLVGGVYAGEGVVCPVSSQEGCSFFDLRERLKTDPERASQHSLMSQAVIGNLLALELLHAVTGIPKGAMSDEKDAGNWTLHVTPGPEITRRPVFVAPGYREEELEPFIELAEKGAQTTQELLHEVLQPLFDPYTGILEMDDNALKQIPLAHSCIRIHLPRSLASAQAPLALAWATNYEMARHRAYLKALQLYGESVESALNARSMSPLVVAENVEDWCGLALAQALMANPKVLVAHGRFFEIDAKWIEDAEINVLLKILRLYTSELPRLRIHCVPGLPAFRCRASFAEYEREEVGRSWQEAVLEAVGGLLSGLQFPNLLEQRVEMIASPNAPAIRSPHSSWFSPVATDEVESILSHLGLKIRQRPFTLDPALRISKLLIGRIELQVQND